MSRVRILAATTVLCAVVAAGCGIGPGSDSGHVQLTITRDYGTEVLKQGSEPIKESDNVLRVLDRNADVETRYGGGFVQSIDGLSGGESDGRRTDWFFYVNGIESSVGAAEYDLSDGDRIWWDHHDWSSAMRVPAVVGSWPEPFVHGFEGTRWESAINCMGERASCDLVADRLSASGTTPAEPNPDAITVTVGPWSVVRRSGQAQLLSQGPSESGVFATFSGRRRPLLTLLNDHGEPAGSLGRGAGLVAALRDGDGPPTWVVTGTDAAGVRAAAELLGNQLTDHFALATDGGQAIPVPVQ